MLSDCVIVVRLISSFGVDDKSKPLALFFTTGHLLHQHCAETWFARQKSTHSLAQTGLSRQALSCPVCRTVMVSQDAEHMFQTCYFSQDEQANDTSTQVSATLPQAILASLPPEATQLLGLIAMLRHMTKRLAHADREPWIAEIMAAEQTLVGRQEHVPTAPSSSPSWTGTESFKQCRSLLDALIARLTILWAEQNALGVAKTLHRYLEPWQTIAKSLKRSRVSQEQVQKLQAKYDRRKVQLAQMYDSAAARSRQETKRHDEKVESLVKLHREALEACKRQHTDLVQKVNNEWSTKYASLRAQVDVAHSNAIEWEHKAERLTKDLERAKRHWTRAEAKVASMKRKADTMRKCPCKSRRLGTSDGHSASSPHSDMGTTTLDTSRTDQDEDEDDSFVLPPEFTSTPREASTFAEPTKRKIIMSSASRSSLAHSTITPSSLETRDSMDVGSGPSHAHQKLESVGLDSKASKAPFPFAPMVRQNPFRRSKTLSSSSLTFGGGSGGQPSHVALVSTTGEFKGQQRLAVKSPVKKPHGLDSIIDLAASSSPPPFDHSSLADPFSHDDPDDLMSNGVQRHEPNLGRAGTRSKLTTVKRTFE